MIFCRSELINKIYLVLLMAAACVLFGISNCVTGWFLFVPVLLLISRISIKSVWLAGGIYGSLSYLCYATWLFTFSKVAMLGVAILYFVFWASVFFILKLIQLKFDKLKIIGESLVILFLEILKSSGFAGFCYGVCGYTQYENLYMIQIADFAGVWAVSFILILCSVLTAEFFECEKSDFFKKNKIYCFLFLCLIVFSYGYGFWKIGILKQAESESEKISFALIQNNSDPWKSGFQNYSNTVDELIMLSENAIELKKDVDFIVWPETAVVPSILKHYDGKDEKRKQLVHKVLDYIDSKQSVFVIGNFNSSGIDDYNSVFVFVPGKNVIPPEPYHYEKQHLVPFTEYFPYTKAFPWLYRMLLNGDTHLWTPGTESVVFDVNDFSFSTPVCFEDNFSSLCRKFVKNGAKAFVSLSNDAWSKSEKCQIQHLKMAVFRSVENHVPSVRCSVSGETCIINSYGKIENRIKSFEKSVLIGNVSKLAM